MYIGIYKEPKIKGKRDIMLAKKRVFLKEFFALAIPIMLQQLSNNILNICDTIMVGKVSDLAISAVTVANKTFLVYSMFIFGVTSGISLFMSQYYGAGKMNEARNTLKFGMQFCLVITAVFLLLLCIAPELAIDLFVDGKQIINLGTEYISIVRWSYIPVALSWTCAVYFRVFKKQNLPMIVGMISVALNILFNYMFIYGKLGIPRMGIRGAAVATTTARFIEFFILITIIFVFNNGKEIFFDTTNKSLTIKKKINIIKKTIPLMLNEGLWGIALSLVFKNYCYVSETYIPAITVVDNVFDMMNVAYVGCSMASGIVIGKVLGTGDMKAAWKTAKRLIIIGLTVSILASVIVGLIAGVIPTIFSLTGSVFAMSTTLLRIKAAFSWSQGYGETVYYILRAGGSVKEVLWLDGLFNLYGPFLVSAVAAYMTDWPIQIVYLCTEATYLLKLFIATYFFKKGKWCNNLTGN